MTDTVNLQLTWDEAEALNTFLNVQSGFYALVKGKIEGPETEAAERACTKLHMAVTGAPSPWSDFSDAE